MIHAFFKKRKKTAIILLWIITSCILLFLSFNRHNNHGHPYCLSNDLNDRFRSEIWADKGGYYVYLPALFNYHFQATEFPDSADYYTGNGFSIDKDHNKIISKYTYGIALLQAPFYLITNILAHPLGYHNDGFSLIYYRMVNVAAIFYLMMGLFFLLLFLRYYFKDATIYLVLFFLFTATNLFYYTIDESGMSHVYLFFLFSLFLFLIKKSNFLEYRQPLLIFVTGITAGLIFIIRPTSIIFLLSYFFLDYQKKDFILRTKRLFEIKKFIPFSIGFILSILPQMIYWKYAYGSFLVYSYAGESFNWLHPQFMHVLFSPNNGLFLYSPFYMMLIIGMIFMIKNKIMNGYYILFTFLIITYIFSSWWSWNFGCSFGGRSYIEYLTLFSLPFAYLAETVNKDILRHKTLFWSSMILLALINIKLSYSFGDCYFGNGDWDWHYYFDILL